MLAANKVEQKTESIIILDKVLKDFPLLLSIEIIFPYNYLGFTSHSYIYIFQLLLFYPDTLCTSPECLDQLLWVLALPKLFLKVASDNCLLVVAHLFFSYSLLKLLNLVKTTDQVFFIVAFNIVCNCLHIVVQVVNFASIELVLNVVG